MGVRVREKVQGSGQWWLFVAHGGRRTSKLIGDRKAALAAKREVELALARGDLRLTPTPKVPIFAEVAEEWMRQYPHLRGVRPSTSEAAASALKHHLLPPFGRLRVDEITPRQIRAFVAGKLQPGGSARWADKSLSVGAVKNILKVLRPILQLAVDDGLLPRNPAVLGRGSLPARPATEHADPFTTDELRAIMRAAEHSKYPEMALLFEVWMRSGMRAGEVLGLQEQDIDYANGLVTVTRSWSRSRLGPTKTRRTRMVSIQHPIGEATREWRPGVTPEAREIVARLRARRVQGIGEAFVFGGGRRPLHPAVVNQRWRRILGAAGVRYREPEQLRHTFASTMLSRGAPLTYVQAQGGWKSAAVLLTYYGRWLPTAELHRAAPLLHPEPLAREHKPTGTDTSRPPRTSFLNSREYFFTK